MYRLAILPVLALVLLAACGGDDSGGSPQRSPSASGLTVYTDPSGIYSFQYPASWSIETYGATRGPRIASFKLKDWDGKFLTGDVMVDLLTVDIGQLAYRPVTALSTTVGGQDGWENSETSDGTGGGDATWKSRTTVTTSYQNSGYVIIGSFGDNPADYTVFDQIVASFEFGG